MRITRISQERWDDHPQDRELIDPGTYVQSGPLPVVNEVLTPRDGLTKW